MKMNLNYKSGHSLFLLGIGIFTILQYLNSGAGILLLCLASIGFLWWLSVQDNATKTINAYVAYAAIFIVFMIQFCYICSYAVNTVYWYLIKNIILIIVLKLLSKHLKGKIGEGDFDAAYIIILCVGFEGFIYTFIIACSLAVFKYIPLIITDFKSLKKISVPFIPYMYIGYLVVLLLWKEMIAI